jgi:hypothetical protein
MRRSGARKEARSADFLFEFLIRACWSARTLRLTAMQFFIRDTASSSGTFLNHIRLSSPNTESKPTQINVNSDAQTNGRVGI